jgi:hypothetical protein
MLLSDGVSYVDAYAALEAASSRLGRAVNPVLMRQDFAKRFKGSGSAPDMVLAQRKSVSSDAK